MITEEQVKAALSAYFGRYAGGIIPSYMVHDMRSALEAYEQSKLVTFDINDESTYPKLYENVITNKGLGYLTEYGEFLNSQTRVSYEHVTYWQPLPMFNWSDV